MADYWIKWYHEIIDDPKMATLPDRLWRRFSELCLLGGKLCPDKSGKLPDTRQLAWLLRMTTDELQIDLDQLAATHLIEPIPNGWLIVNFEKRQRAATSTERVHQHRERKQRQQYNGDETQLKRNVTQINRLTEADTETETEHTIGDVPVSDPLSDAFTNATGIVPHDLDRWVKASQEMAQNGITPDEIPVTIQKMDKDGLQYSGLWSIKNTAIWVHNRRKNNQPIFSDNNPKAGGRPAKQSKADAAAAAFGVSGGSNGNG